MIYQVPYEITILFHSSALSLSLSSAYEYSSGAWFFSFDVERVQSFLIVYRGV